MTKVYKPKIWAPHSVHSAQLILLISQRQFRLIKIISPFVCVNRLFCYCCGHFSFVVFLLLRCWYNIPHSNEFRGENFKMKRTNTKKKHCFWLNFWATSVGLAANSYILVINFEMMSLTGEINLKTTIAGIKSPNLIRRKIIHQFDRNYNIFFSASLLNMKCNFPRIRKKAKRLSNLIGFFLCSHVRQPILKIISSSCKVARFYHRCYL